MFQPTHPTRLRTITLEEHFATPAYMEHPGRRLQDLAQGNRADPQAAAGFADLVARLCDLDARRLADMDAGGIDVQVVSLNSPGVEGLAPAEAVTMARAANDALADAVRRHPDRLAGFAALPMADPAAAAAELERMVVERSFCGAVINGHSRGRYLDDQFFWPVLERAEALGVPIYLHPAAPPQPVIDAYYTGNFSAEVTAALATSGWGWHIETAVHVLRLILSAAFDRYPRLQLIIGHLGEGLPFMLPRIDRRMSRDLTGLARPVAAYLRENVYYTISGFNFTPTFLDTYLEVGAEHILFSADYPYGSPAEARAFLESLPVSAADRERIAHGNAERLLRL